MVPLNPVISIGVSSFSRLHGNFMGNVNPGLINPRLFNWRGYHFSSHLLLFGGTTTINQPGFINPGLTLYISFRHPHFPHFTGENWKSLQLNFGVYNRSLFTFIGVYMGRLMWYLPRKAQTPMMFTFEVAKVGSQNNWNTNYSNDPLFDFNNSFKTFIKYSISTIISLFNFIPKSSNPSKNPINSFLHNPYAPCMEYLPTCTLKITRFCS